MLGHSAFADGNAVLFCTTCVTSKEGYCSQCDALDRLLMAMRGKGSVVRCHSKPH